MSTLSTANGKQLETRLRATRGGQGFSLVEILVTISLLSFIVLGLLMMFNQTQRAFRGGMAQTDVMESGRLLTDRLSREIEQMSATEIEPVNPGLIYDLGYPGLNYVNFFTASESRFQPPLLQGLPGSAYLGDKSIQDNRTNVVQRFFFMSRQNQDWTGTGYVVIQHHGQHVGTLYSFSETIRPPFTNFNLRVPNHLLQLFQSSVDTALQRVKDGIPLTNLFLHRMADGIVHLRVTPFARNGHPLIPGYPLLSYPAASNLVYRLPDGTYKALENSFWAAGNSAVWFVGDGLPAQVDLEIGILEPNILNRYKGMSGNEVVQRNYLSNRVGNVHLFRQRIPVRNVELSLY